MLILSRTLGSQAAAIALEAVVEAIALRTPRTSRVSENGIR
ncbi:hypothetical protein ACN4EG_07670 [Alkalinema pantanalense CENA528]